MDTLYGQKLDDNLSAPGLITKELDATLFLRGGGVLEESLQTEKKPKR